MSRNPVGQGGRRRVSWDTVFKVYGAPKKEDSFLKRVKFVKTQEVIISLRFFG